ncbi:MAG: hypothetical protein NZ518_10195, partial [Dehalococcoidia bacterium]|nr:hypothetical protein [Dehalococcoidia bacterium]
GVAVFAAPTHVITPGTVPIDAVFFGSGLGTAVVSGGSAGYQLPVNDNYSGGKLQTSSFLAPDSASGQALRATGTFNLATGTFSTARTWANGVFDIGRSGVTLTVGSPVNAHPQLACQSPVFIQAGSSGSAVITARDTDGIISNVASIVGTTYPGLPTITPFASASVITTTLVAPPTTQQGVYTATLEFQNTDSTPVTATCTVELVVGPAPDATGRIFIGGVQGPGHVSPFFGTGRAITGTNFISGVITARFGNGFWVQDPTDSNDGNDLTSDGIFVFTGSPTPVTATVGTRVQVQGYVSEFRARTDGLQITQITSRSSSSIAATRVITYLSTGNPLPTPIVIGAGGRTPPNQFIDGVSQGGLLEYRTRPFDPTTRGIDFYEALEGMLVQVNDPVVVGATNGFGEVWVLGDDGGPVGPNAVRMARGGIGIGPGNFNPQRL